MVHDKYISGAYNRLAFECMFAVLEAATIEKLWAQKRRRTSLSLETDLATGSTAPTVVVDPRLISLVSEPLVASLSDLASSGSDVALRMLCALRLTNHRFYTLTKLYFAPILSRLQHDASVPFSLRVPFQLLLPENDLPIGRQLTPAWSNVHRHHEWMNSAYAELGLERTDAAECRVARALRDFVHVKRCANNPPT